MKSHWGTIYRHNHFVETERETLLLLYSKQFDKLFHHVSYGGTHSANSQTFGDWDINAEKNRTDKRKGGYRERLSLVDATIYLGEKAIFVKFEMC